MLCCNWSHGHTCTDNQNPLADLNSPKCWENVIATTCALRTVNASKYVCSHTTPLVWCSLQRSPDQVGFWGVRRGQEGKEGRWEGEEVRERSEPQAKNPDIDVLVFISQILVSFWGFVLSPQQLHSIPWTSLGDFRLRPPAALPGLIRAFPT